MAANQTIIQAAGQRYAPVKTDYSGYIQGIASVATALVEKSKSIKKNQSSIDDLSKGFNSKIKPYEELVKKRINASKTSQEAEALTKHFNEQKLKYEASMDNMQTKLNGKNLSNSIDPETEYWMKSFGNGDFDVEYGVEGKQIIDGVESPMSMLFNMDFKLDENLNAYVMGPKGEYINMDDLGNLLNMPNSTDGIKVTALINNFATLSDNKLKDDYTGKPERNFLVEKVKVKNEIRNLFKVGDGDISGEDVKTAFMFDEISGYVDGDVEGETSFLKYYLSNDELFPPEFKEKYLKYEKMLDSEISEKQLAIIAQDLIANDLNIDSDLDKYIDYLLEFNR